MLEAAFDSCRRKGGLAALLLVLAAVSPTAAAEVSAAEIITHPGQFSALIDPTAASDYSIAVIRFDDVVPNEADESGNLQGFPSPYDGLDAFQFFTEGDAGEQPGVRIESTGIIQFADLTSAQTTSDIRGGSNFLFRFIARDGGEPRAATVGAVGFRVFGSAVSDNQLMVDFYDVEGRKIGEGAASGDGRILAAPAFTAGPVDAMVPAIHAVGFRNTGSGYFGIGTGSDSVSKFDFGFGAWQVTDQPLPYIAPWE